MTNDTWKVQVLGERTKAWEISVVRITNTHGQRSWGWFDAEKILVNSGHHRAWPMAEWVWNQQISMANELCRRLNAGEDLVPKPTQV